jgi:hypothetical protein
VARFGRKHDIVVLAARTGDTQAPAFAQQPLLRTSVSALRVRFAVNKPARVHWTVAYDTVTADYRYQRLGFKSSELSTEQVLDITSQGDAATVLRKLQQSDTSDDIGPIVGWGETYVARSNQLVDLLLDPPCLNGTGMCALSSKGLNPLTDYKVREPSSTHPLVVFLSLLLVRTSSGCECHHVQGPASNSAQVPCAESALAQYSSRCPRAQVHFVLVDDSGNQMRSPDVQKVSTAADTWAPILTLRPPCSIHQGPDCPPGPGLKFCDNVGATYVDMFFNSSEAGAVYYILSKLPTNESNIERRKCELHGIHPGMVLEVPDGAKWSGCQASTGRRSLAEYRRLRGSDVIGSSMSNSHMPAPVGCSHQSSGNSAAPGDIDPSGQLALGEHRRLSADSTRASPDGLTQTPCACCEQNINCQLPFADIWPLRADLADAGFQLVTACAYMKAGACIQMPIMGAPHSPGSRGLLSPSQASPDSLASSVTRLMPIQEHSSLKTPTFQPDDPLERDADHTSFVSDNASTGFELQRAPLPAAFRQLLLGSNLLQTMEIEPGSSTKNGSAADYRYQLAVDAQFRVEGLEPDSFYAIYAVAEDMVRPEPNLTPTAKQWIFQSQRVHPPSCNVSCSITEATEESIQLNVELNTTGTVFYVVQQNGTSVDMPSASYVRFSFDNSGSHEQSLHLRILSLLVFIGRACRALACIISAGAERCSARSSI